MSKKVTGVDAAKRIIYWVKQTMGPLTRTVWNSTNKTLTMQHRNSSSTTTLNLKTELLNLVYPVGSIYISTGTTSPADFLGGTWSIVGTNRVLWGVSASTSAGSTLDEQLPNIKGTWRKHTSASAGNQVTDIGPGSFTSSGAITKTTSSQYNCLNDGSPGTYVDGFTFDAHNSSSVYTDNGIVRPAAYTVHMWRRTS